MALEQILYSAKATATGGRDGSAKSDDGRLDVDLSVPKGLGAMMVRAPILSSFLPPVIQRVLLAR